MAFEVPVLLIVFNRPDLTAEVVEAARKVRPRRLFIAADGPRPDFETDAELCRRTREIASNPDWECEVTTLFQKENLGIGRGESTAISWFFDHVEEGIILEDDCLPSRSFFEFSAYFLDKYRDHQRVASVGGNFFCRPSCGCRSRTIFPSICRSGVGRRGAGLGSITASTSPSCPNMSETGYAKKILRRRSRQNIGNMSPVLSRKGQLTRGIFSSF